MERVELLWNEREQFVGTNLNEKVFIIGDFLNIVDVDKQEITEDNIDCDVF